LSVSAQAQTNILPIDSTTNTITYKGTILLDTPKAQKSNFKKLKYWTSYHYKSSSRIFVEKDKANYKIKLNRWFKIYLRPGDLSSTAGSVIYTAEFGCTDSSIEYHISDFTHYKYIDKKSKTNGYGPCEELSSTQGLDSISWKQIKSIILENVSARAKHDIESLNSYFNPDQLEISNKHAIQVDDIDTLIDSKYKYEIIIKSRSEPKSVKGTLLQISDTSITVANYVAKQNEQIDSSNVTHITYSEINKVQLYYRKGSASGVIVGGVSGGLIGLIIGYSVAWTNNIIDPDPQPMVLGALLGTGVGALIGHSASYKKVLDRNLDGRKEEFIKLKEVLAPYSIN
jgi:hypothetical protein